MATDAIVEAVEQGRGQPTSMDGTDRSYFACKPRQLKPEDIPKATMLFLRRTALKVQRSQDQATRRAAGRHPWKSFPLRTGMLQPTLEHGPDRQEGQAGQARLKVYPAFAAWTDLPELVGRPWCSIMAADHGRSVRDADVVVFGKLSDLQLRTANVAPPSVNER